MWKWGLIKIQNKREGWPLVFGMLPISIVSHLDYCKLIIPYRLKQGLNLASGCNY